MMSSKYYGSSYDPRFRNSYMSQEAWAVTGPIFATPLSRRPCQPDMGALLIAHTPQRAVVLPPPGQEGLVNSRTKSKGHPASATAPTESVPVVPHCAPALPPAGQGTIGTQIRWLAASGCFEKAVRMAMHDSAHGFLMPCNKAPAPRNSSALGGQLVSCIQQITPRWPGLYDLFYTNESFLIMEENGFDSYTWI